MYMLLSAVAKDTPPSTHTHTHVLLTEPQDPSPGDPHHPDPVVFDDKTREESEASGGTVGVALPPDHPSHTYEQVHTCICVSQVCAE